MAHITRCPRCHTAFKVYPDQLRIASGQVRCGHCGAVFDARAHALGAGTGAPRVTPTGTQAPDAVPIYPQGVPTPVWPTLFGEPLEKLHESPTVTEGAEPRSETASHPPASAAARAPVSAPMAFATGNEATGQSPPPAPTPVAAALPDALDIEPGFAPTSEPAFQASAAAARRDEWAPSTGAAPFDISPAASANRTGAAVPRAPGASAGWVILAVLLALLLIAQGTFWQRDWIAARWPVAAPTLRLLCAPIQCAVAPYRRLSAITIVDSKFKATDADTNAYELALTLHNRAALAVATPNLELTLTDAAHEILLRRVLAADELGAPPALAAGASVLVQRQIQITTPLPAGPVANYRLTAFYP